MPRFPAQQAKILALAEAMISGYTERPSLFPSADLPSLQAAKDAYNTASAAATEAAAAAKLAIEAKQATLAELQVVIKRELKRSQLDTEDNPKNLEFIGWGPRAAARTIEPPGQPLDLESVEEGAGTLLIEWKHPLRTSGGPVRTYIVERRELAMGQTPGEWEQAGISLETKALLKKQPRAAIIVPPAIQSFTVKKRPSSIHPPDFSVNPHLSS